MKKFLYRIVLMILEELLPEIVRMILEELRDKNPTMSPSARSTEIVEDSINRILGEQYTELFAREQILSSSDKAVKSIKDKYHA